MAALQPLYKSVATPPVGRHDIVSVNEDKSENFPSSSVIFSSMRVTIELLTSGIRAVLSCRLDISCSSPSQAAQPLPAAASAAAAAPAASPSPFPSPSPRSSPLEARHVRHTVSALGRLERTASARRQARRGRGAQASDGSSRCSSGEGAGSTLVLALGPPPGGGILSAAAPRETRSR